MNFTHVACPDMTELDTTTGADGKRHYVTPQGVKYPSVTTVLSLDSAEGIAKWRARVGAEVADKISNQASVRGTAVHQLCEDYINNVEDFKKGQMPANIGTFNILKPELDAHLNNIVMQEVPLYSHYLKVGGRVDCIGDWKGELSIIDFKTAKKPKRREWIGSYFMQAASYAVMFEELTKIPINNLVVAIACDDGEPQIFTGKRDDYIHDFIKLRARYEELHGI